MARPFSDSPAKSSLAPLGFSFATLAHASLTSDMAKWLNTVAPYAFWSYNDHTATVDSEHVDLLQMPLPISLHVPFLSLRICIHSATYLSGSRTTSTVESVYPLYRDMTISFVTTAGYSDSNHIISKFNFTIIPP